MRSVKFLALCAAVFLIAGCGYTYKSVITEKYKTIYVETFKNKIELTDKITSKNPYKMYRPGSEQDITNAVIHRFIYDGTLKITRQDEADLIMTGELIDYNRAPVRYDDNDNILEYRVSITVNISVKDTKTGEYLIESKRVATDANYITTGKFEATEADALKLATQDLARRIVEKTADVGW